MEREIILALLIVSILMVLRMIVYEVYKRILIKKSNELIKAGMAIFALQEQNDFDLSRSILVQGKPTDLEYYNYLAAIKYIIKASEILLEPMTPKFIHNDSRFVEINRELIQIKLEATEILENYFKGE